MISSAVEKANCPALVGSLKGNETLLPSGGTLPENMSDIGKTPML